MANTEVIEKTTEAVVEATENGFAIPETGIKEAGIFAAGVATTIVVEHVVIPAAKKGWNFVTSKIGKTKTVVVTAEEVVEVEE